MKRIYLTLVVLAMLMAHTLKAQVIAGWNLKAYTTGNNSIPGNLNATSQDPNIQTPVLSRGSGLTSSDVNFAYFSNVTSTSTTGNLAADAVNNGDFYLVTLKATTGTMNVTKINYQLYRSANGPNTFRWAYSIDGGAFVNVGPSDVTYTGTDNLGLMQTAIDVSAVTALQNVPSTSTVTFRLLGWGATTGTRRFGLGRNSSASDNALVLSFEGSLSTTLPVELTSFTAKAQANAVQLNWQTASEQRNSHFEILRSADGATFNVIGTKAGNGTTQNRQYYSFEDKQPLNGTSYYALKQFDEDGMSKLYDAIPIKLNLVPSIFTVTPSFTGISIQVGAVLNEKANVSIVDISGNKIMERQLLLNKGTNQLEIDNVALVKGKLYIVNLKSASINQTAKIIR